MVCDFVAGAVVGLVFLVKFVWCGGSEVVVFDVVGYGGVVSYLGFSVISSGGGLVSSHVCHVLSWV